MKLFKGTQIDIEFHYLDSLLQAKDVSSYTFKVVAKRDVQQTDPEFELTTFDVSNADVGLIILNLDTTDLTPNYYVCQCVATKTSSIIASNIFVIEIMESLL